jgi:hypothetical protein
MTELLARIHSNNVLAQFDQFIDQFTDLETHEDEAVVFALLSEINRRIEARSTELRDRIKARFEAQGITGKQYYTTPDGAHTVCLTMTARTSVTFDEPALKSLLTSRNIPLTKAGKVSMQIDESRLRSVLEKAGLTMEEVCTETFTPDFKKVEKLAATNMLSVEELSQVCETRTTYALSKDFMATSKMVDIGVEQVE